MAHFTGHEPFLRAIFDAPDDDTPRLVYPDFLDENGQPERAELIRVQCELARLPSGAAELTRRERELLVALAARGPDASSPRRGFRATDTIAVSADVLADGDRFRELSVTTYPEWFGA